MQDIQELLPFIRYKHVISYEQESQPWIIVTIKVIRQLYEADMKMLGACESWVMGPSLPPHFFLEGTGHVWCLACFFVDEGDTYEVFVAVLCSSFGTPQSTADGMAKPLSCCLDFFLLLWFEVANHLCRAVVLFVNGQTYPPPRTEKDSKKVKKGKKSKKDTADYWFFTWLETYNLSQLQQLIPRQGMRWQSIELHGLTFHHMAMQWYAALQWTRASFQNSIYIGGRAPA